MLSVTNVVGARPNFIKIAPIMKEMSRRTDLFRPRLVHTGRFYDEKMSVAFFEELGIPRPGVDLGCGGGLHAQQTAALMLAFEREPLPPLPSSWSLEGSLHTTRLRVLKAENRSLEERAQGWIVPRERTVNINTPLDLRLAEKLLDEPRRPKEDR